MALLQLDEEQIRTWTRAQKDEWWFKNVFRGDMPQLTIRSAITGFLLGGILAATGLYIGAKTGISIGVGLTSVILAFALFRIMHGAGHRGGLHHPREQLHAVDRHRRGLHGRADDLQPGGLHAGHRHASSRGGSMVIWMCVVSIIGVLLAFPMKRRFINEDQLPFPEGRASGVVLDALYTGAAERRHVQGASCWAAPRCSRASTRPSSATAG